MGMSKAQASIWVKARSLGAGGQAVSLSDEMCAYLVGRIVLDLGLEKSFSEVPHELPGFFSKQPLPSLVLPHVDCRALYERLVTKNADTDVYFACLAALHKARLKYERILSTQPIATMEQIGPRGLLQYGQLGGRAMIAWLFWRKWFFDIDNRAGQETGYLFEPIIAYAIGGTPAPSKKSPVKRSADPDKGRQVDCILEKRAYEFKIRVTIAASGQGRWQEELDFPLDCRQSGFTPVLICMDSTRNPKLDALIRAFREHDGEAFVGDAAWAHLEEVAGATMSIFLQRYVRTPIQDLLKHSKTELPELTATWSDRAIDIGVAGETLRIQRDPGPGEDESEAMPEDAVDEFGTP